MEEGSNLHCKRGGVCQTLTAFVRQFSRRTNRYWQEYDGMCNKGSWEGVKLPFRMRRPCGTVQTTNNTYDSEQSAWSTNRDFRGRRQCFREIGAFC